MEILALNSGIQTYQISTNNYEVCNPSLSSIFLAVLGLRNMQENLENSYSDRVHGVGLKAYVEI